MGPRTLGKHVVVAALLFFAAACVASTGKDEAMSGSGRSSEFVHPKPDYQIVYDKGRVRLVAGALSAYVRSEGCVPKVDRLEGYGVHQLSADELLDERGNPIRLEADVDQYYITAAGRDGKFGTIDDVEQLRDFVGQDPCWETTATFALEMRTL